MTRDEFQTAAEFYSRIDKLAYLMKASFEFDQASGHLIATYLVDCDIAEADEGNRTDCNDRRMTGSGHSNAIAGFSCKAILPVGGRWQACGEFRRTA